MYIYIRKHTYIHTRGGGICAYVYVHALAAYKIQLHYKFIFFPLFFSPLLFPLYPLYISSSFANSLDIFYIYIIYIIVSSNWFCFCVVSSFPV